jgi:hypothetical protein
MYILLRLAVQLINVPVKPDHATLKSDESKYYQSARSSMAIVRIRVRMHPPHPVVRRKRRLNGAVLRMRPEKSRPRVTAGVTRWRSLPAQRSWAPIIGLTFAALHWQWWRLHKSEKFLSGSNTVYQQKFLKNQRNWETDKQTKFQGKNHNKRILLFTVLRLAEEVFTYLETSPLPVKPHEDSG